jgi:hypothetical protein
MTVVETRQFEQRAAARMSDSEREAFILDIAAHPEAGDIVPGTGGVRKARWGYGSKGKRGGVRVMYYYHTPALPVFLLTVFAKNERADISPREKVLLKRLTASLVKEYQGRGAHDQGRR